LKKYNVWLMSSFHDKVIQKLIEKLNLKLIDRAEKTSGYVAEIGYTYFVDGPKDKLKVLDNIMSSIESKINNLDIFSYEEANKVACKILKEIK